VAAVPGDVSPTPLKKKFMYYAPEENKTELILYITFHVEFTLINALPNSKPCLIFSSLLTLSDFSE
jgi:hypothetical protein